MTILKLFLVLGFLVSIAKIEAIDTKIIPKSESKATMVELYNQEDNQEDDSFDEIFASCSDVPEDEQKQDDQKNESERKQHPQETQNQQTSLLVKILSIFF